MIQSRKSIIEKAINNAVGSPRDLSLEKQLDVDKKEIKIDQKEKDSMEIKDKVIKQPIDNQLENTKDNNLTDETTENFANFFNGEVINLEKDNQSPL